MRINNNIAALNTYRQLSFNSANASRNMEKLSSGLRINRAADDAAGLSISEKMRGQIRGLEQAQRNAQDGVSMIQVADGALGEVQSVLHRMEELSTQAMNDTNGDSERTAIFTELSNLHDQIDSIKDTTKFNGKSLLSDAATDAAGEVQFQIGANSAEDFTLDFATDGINLDAVVDAGGTTGLKDALDAIQTKITTNSTAPGLTADDFSAVLDAAQSANELISTGRASLGATQNRLEYSINLAANTSENLTAAESRIRDVDMAKEMMQFTKNNILTQAAQSMLAQANQQPQSVLQLLR